MSQYVLESSSEFERLERQSKSDSYNYQNELKGFHPKTGGQILDAGCGSGVVSRFLASQFKESNIIGCDFSDERVKQADAKAKEDSIPNLKFQAENLTRLSFGASHFDGVVCRYVLEHLDESSTLQALAELHRVLKPSGEICLIDIDGFIFNAFPQTELVQKVLGRLAEQKNIDLNIGRKLPHFLAKSGFANISWRIETLSFSGEKLKEESTLMAERFKQVAPFFERLAGSKKLNDQFVSEYLEGLKSPDAVLFYNKFIVSATKQGFQKIT